MRPQRIALPLALAAALAGCGDKVPESEAAKKLGAQPKQVIDKAAAEVQKAVQQGTERRAEAEKKE